MKKFICAVAASVCLISAGAAYAGSGHHNGERHSHKGMHLFEQKLELTDEQKAQIAEIHQSASEGRTDSRGSRGMKRLAALDPGAANYHEQAELLAQECAEKLEQAIHRRAEVHAQVYAVLTTEQREKLKEVKSQMQQRHEERAARRGNQQAQ